MHAEQRTSRFIAEYQTAQRIKTEAAKRGHDLTLEQAHNVWAEYSAERAAQWLVFDSENPVAEIWRAITCWTERHTIKPRRR